MCVCARAHACLGLVVLIEITEMANQVDLLKDKLGFDEAFNYKEESDLNMALKRSVHKDSME